MNDRSAVTNNQEGGIFSTHVVRLTDAASVHHNVGGQGAGIASYGTVSMSGTAAVRANRSNSSHGGGIWISRGRLVMKQSSRVHANESGPNGLGGGIFLLRSSMFGHDSTSVSGNTTRFLGGGIYNYRGEVRLTDHARVELNVAGQAGGGIYNDRGLVSLLEDAKVVRNEPNDCSFCMPGDQPRRRASDL